MKIGRIWTLLKEVGSHYSADKVPKLSAALAYYTIFSLAPFLIIAISIAGFFLGDEARAGIIGQIEGIIGRNGAEAVAALIKAASDKGTSVMASVIGIVMLFVGALGLFGEIQSDLDLIWGVEPQPGRGILGLLRDRLISFSALMGTCFLLLVSLVASAMLAVAGKYFESLFPIAPWLLELMNAVVSTGVIMLLFAMIFKLLPDVKIAWRDVWVGALLTAILFVVGKWGVGMYIGKRMASSAYGATGSVLVVLLWVYFSSQILFIGAEFTKVYAKHFGSKVVPKKGAVSQHAFAASPIEV